MTTLVTGGAGYIGSVLTAKLLDSGHEVIVLDSLVNGQKEAVDSRAKFVSGDVSDVALLKKIFAENGVEAVAHLAGYIEVSESVKNPEKYFENNYEKPKVLIKEMLAAGVKNIIFSSTAAVYGVPQEDLITEDHPTNPINPYGESKLKFEKFLLEQKKNGLNSISLRFFNASGATKEHGETHVPETHLIPILIKCALGETQEVDIYGTDYETKDGSALRDYVHVEDIALAHLLLFQKMVAGESLEPVYNIGSGVGFTVLEVVSAVEKVSGKKLSLKYAPRRAGDPAKLVASLERIKSLDWAPKHSQIGEIVSTAWNWHVGRTVR